MMRIGFRRTVTAGNTFHFLLQETLNSDRLSGMKAMLDFCLYFNLDYMDS